MLYFVLLGKDIFLHEAITKRNQKRLSFILVIFIFVAQDCSNTRWNSQIKIVEFVSVFFFRFVSTLKMKDKMKINTVQNS